MNEKQAISEMDKHLAIAHEANEVAREIERRLTATKRERDWRPIETAPEGRPVWTKIDDERGSRNECLLRRNRGLWYYVDDSMYVYYCPTHWAEPQEER